MTQINVLYRVFNADGDLLYVGATTNPALRFTAHNGAKDWWCQATSITMEHFAEWDRLVLAEAEAIRSENPRYNEQHTDKPPRRKGKPRRAPGEGSLSRRGDGIWIGIVELPSRDGKRRQKRVYSKDRATAELKLAALRASVPQDDELEGEPYFYRDSLGRLCQGRRAERTT